MAAILKEGSSTQNFKIINVMASSIDGFVAAHDGQSDAERADQGFTESEDRDHLEELIKSADAIILGSQTLIAGGGALDVRKRNGAYPIWVTFTNKGIPAVEKFWAQTQIPRWLISSFPLEGDVNVLDGSQNFSPETLPENSQIFGSLDAAKPLNLVYGHADPVQFVINALKSAGCNRVLLFGGGFINQLFYTAKAVHELILTLCPVLVAQENAVPLVNPGLPDIQKFVLKSVDSRGNLIFIHYTVIR